MADYYGTVAAADTYHAAHGNAVWAASDEDAKEVALLIASEWLDARYGSSFSGYRAGMIDQTREWPRIDAYDRWGYPIAQDAVPACVAQATYEVALRQVTSPGSLNKDWTPGKEKLSVSVVGAVSVTYAGAFSYLDAQVQIGGIGAILGPVLTGEGATSSYSGRASRV